MLRTAYAGTLLSLRLQVLSHSRCVRVRQRSMLAERRPQFRCVLTIDDVCSRPAPATAAAVRLAVASPVAVRARVQGRPTAAWRALASCAGVHSESIARFVFWPGHAHGYLTSALAAVALAQQAFYTAALEPTLCAALVLATVCSALLVAVVDAQLLRCAWRQFDTWFVWGNASVYVLTSLLGQWAPFAAASSPLFFAAVWWTISWCLCTDALLVDQRRKRAWLAALLTVAVARAVFILLREQLGDSVYTQARVCLLYCARLRTFAMAALGNIAAFMTKQVVLSARGLWWPGASLSAVNLRFPVYLERTRATLRLHTQLPRALLQRVFPPDSLSAVRHLDAQRSAVDFREVPRAAVLHAPRLARVRSSRAYLGACVGLAAYTCAVMSLPDQSVLSVLCIVGMLAFGAVECACLDRTLLALLLRNFEVFFLLGHILLPAWCCRTCQRPTHRQGRHGQPGLAGVGGDARRRRAQPAGQNHRREHVLAGVRPLVALRTAAAATGGGAACSVPRTWRSPKARWPRALCSSARTSSGCCGTAGCRSSQWHPACCPRSPTLCSSRTSSAAMRSVLPQVTCPARLPVHGAAS